MVLCVTEPDFLKKEFCPQSGENESKMGPKKEYLNLLKYLALFSL